MNNSVDVIVNNCLRTKTFGDGLARALVVMCVGVFSFGLVFCFLSFLIFNTE